MKVFIRLYTEDNGILLDANRLYRDTDNNLLNVYKGNELVGVFSLVDVKLAYISKPKQ